MTNGIDDNEITAQQFNSGCLTYVGTNLKFCRSHDQGICAALQRRRDCLLSYSILKDVRRLYVQDLQYAPTAQYTQVFFDLHWGCCCIQPAFS